MSVSDEMRYRLGVYLNQEKAVAKQIKGVTKQRDKGKVKAGFVVADFPCERCGGRKHCVDCRGSGEVPRRGGLMKGVRSLAGASLVTKCPFCKGSGICGLCRGEGIYLQKRSQAAS